MGKKREFQLYTIMWLVAIFILILLLWQNIGNARIINYSGILRGGTQKLVKEELSQHPDNEMITYLDDILINLQTGNGKYDLIKNNDMEYQNNLFELKTIWTDIKEEIKQVRENPSHKQKLYQLSQQHFDKANDMVMIVEISSEQALSRSIIFYFFSIALSVGVFSIFNIRSRKSLMKSIYTDNLTGIFNRTGFENAAKEIRHRLKDGYSVVELDIDNFKTINHLYGYQVGDQLLIKLASTFQETYHDEEICARIDADDFVILVKHSSQLLSQIRDLLNQVLQEMQTYDLSDGITFTMGAYHIDSDESMKTIMDKANTAHKIAKQDLKNSLIWYDEEVIKQLEFENLLIERIDRSLENKEFIMYLQPKVSFEDMSVQHAEALVRWDFPGLGIMYPDSFIPLFEKKSLISKLDFYMLEQACQYIQKQIVSNDFVPKISVNFSRVTLHCKPFYEKILAIVDNYNIPHEYIEIEITESAFNEVESHVIDMLFHLKHDGFLISMDDFGSGYSSLSMINKLPIDIIKIDKEFLKELKRNENVITFAVDLAHSLNIKIVSEGVEEVQQVEFLKLIHCDYGQGYYFSKPITQNEFNEKYGHKLSKDIEE